MGQAQRSGAQEILDVHTQRLAKCSQSADRAAFLAVLDLGQIALRDSGCLGQSAKGQATMLAPDPDGMLAGHENPLSELNRHILRIPGRCPRAHLGQRQGVGGIL